MGLAKLGKQERLVPWAIDARRATRQSQHLHIVRTCWTTPHAFAFMRFYEEGTTVYATCLRHLMASQTFCGHYLSVGQHVVDVRITLLLASQWQHPTDGSSDCCYALQALASDPGTIMAPATVTIQQRSRPQTLAACSLGKST